MSVLSAMPTARPSCADDSEERTTLFRPAQKRPTWQDVERERARRAVPTPPAAEVTRFFPREGRAPPARLQVVPTPPPPARVGTAPRAEKHPTPEYLKPGYVFPGALTGEQKDARDIRSCREGLATIRPTPDNLSRLLSTREWKGARVEGTVPSPEIPAAERAVEESKGRVAETEREIHETEVQLSQEGLAPHVRLSLEGILSRAKAALAQRQPALVDARKRLYAVRTEEWLHVVHPSGASIRIRPTWGAR